MLAITTRRSPEVAAPGSVTESVDGLGQLAGPLAGGVRWTRWNVPSGCDGRRISAGVGGFVMSRGSVLLLVQLPLEIVKVSVTTPEPPTEVGVKVVAASLGLLKVPEPFVTVHCPVMPAGTAVAFRLTLEPMQKFVFGAGVGGRNVTAGFG